MPSDFGKGFCSAPASGDALRLGAPVRVTHLERSTEGFSQETFVFDVELGRERRGYVAKREPVAGLLEPYDLEPEFRVLHALSEDPLPSPPTPTIRRSTWPPKIPRHAE